MSCLNKLHLRAITKYKFKISFIEPETTQIKQYSIIIIFQDLHNYSYEVIFIFLTPKFVSSFYAIVEVYLFKINLFILLLSNLKSFNQLKILGSNVKLSSWYSIFFLPVMQDSAVSNHILHHLKLQQISIKYKIKLRITYEDGTAVLVKDNL